MKWILLTVWFIFPSGEVTLEGNSDEWWDTREECMLAGELIPNSRMVSGGRSEHLMTFHCYSQESGE